MKLSLKTKLRIRFVLICAVSLSVMLGLIVSVSIYSNYRDLGERSDMILHQLKEHPDLNVRYFSVKVHPGKSAVRLDVVQNVDISPEDGAKLAKTTMKSGEDSGFVQDYRYLIIKGDSGIRILFLSRSSALETARAAAENMVWISAASLLAVTLLLIPLSGKIVAPLMENHRKQKEFITAASHQLKTPLTVIGADAQLLSMEIGENEWIDSILYQVERMTKMTSDLVTLSKAEELEDAREKALFSLSDAVTETATLYKAVAEKKQIDFSVSVSEQHNFRGNEEDFCHLLTLLLDNAFKYCPDGGKIDLALKKELRGLSISLANTTKPLSNAPLLSQRFYRGENTEGQDGFGLGLAVANSLVARMGGKLSVALPEKELFRAEILLH